MARSEAEMEALAKEWLAGPGDDLEDLYDCLQDDLGLEDESDEAWAARSRADEIVEALISDLDVTDLNKRRIRSWCQSIYSPPGYEALLGPFWRLLSEDEKTWAVERAEHVFIAEFIVEYLDRDEWHRLKRPERVMAVLKGG